MKCTKNITILQLFAISVIIFTVFNVKLLHCLLQYFSGFIAARFSQNFLYSVLSFLLSAPQIRGLTWADKMFGLVFGIKALKCASVWRISPTLQNITFHPAALEISGSDKSWDLNQINMWFWSHSGSWNI